MNMEIQNLPTLEIRAKLREIRTGYQTALTREHLLEYKAQAKPLIVELNKRMREKWEQSGGPTFSNYPTQFTFEKIITHGI